MAHAQYDVLVVGAGIAGSSMAYALSTITSKNRETPLKIALLERSLSEPDRIVGELLQPGGVGALKKMGMESCLEDIDAIPVHGYCVTQSGRLVHIPYPAGFEGRSFHHGRFIMALRAKVKQVAHVDVLEATVSDLIECEYTQRVIGVRATRSSSSDGGAKGEKEPFYAGLVIIADGCFSNFRTVVMGEAARQSSTRSHFVGAILKNVKLPMPQHGTVALVRGQGPVLLYQISEHDTRMLVDVKQPLPSDLKGHILQNVTPHLPSELHLAIHNALEGDRLRRMPNSFLPPVEQGGKHMKEGVILLGDAWNMRHPLTGGGMTVALNDVVILAKLLTTVDNFERWDNVSEVLHHWHWQRKPLSATINILSVALYDLFGADGELLAVLQTGCFKYFELGGECINGPVSLLSGITPSPMLLAYHFFSVALYAIWVLFMHPRLIPGESPDTQKPIIAKPSVLEYPGLCIKSFKVFWMACVVFGPLVWTEIRWW